MAEHVLEPTDVAGGAYSCTVCGLSFRLHPPQWLRECPGVPVYPYDQIPAYLATATQLARDGFRSGGGPAGCYIAYQRQKVVYLFDRGQALSMREPGMPRVQQRATPARATLARAMVELQALRTCASCGRLVPSKHDLFDAGRAGRLCSSCYDRWAHEQDARQDAQQDTMADADAVYRWAAGLLTAVEESGSVPIRIVALATTSLERDAEVVEVAIVDHGGCVLVNSLVQPQRPIPAHATAIHGITDAQVAEAPTLPEMWPQIATALRHARVVAYDAAFAADVLSQGARRHGLTRLTCTWESLGEACRACSDDGEHLLSLQALCREMGIVAEEYQVLGEAQAAIAVIDMLAQRASQAAGRLHGYHEPVASGSDRHEALGSHLRDWLEPVPTARNRYGNIS